MNPIPIEQPKEEMALAFEVHRSAAICAVRLSRSKMAGQPLDEAPKGKLLDHAGIIMPTASLLPPTTYIPHPTTHCRRLLPSTPLLPP